MKNFIKRISNSFKTGRGKPRTQEVIIGRNKLKRPVRVGTGNPLRLVVPFGASSVQDTESDFSLLIQSVAQAGADIVQEVSTFGPYPTTRPHLIEASPVPYGTVLTYEVFDCISKLSTCNEENAKLAVLRVLERQIAQGIDYITVHASITNDFLNNSAPFLSKRLLPLPSRAGGMLVNLFDRFRIDNPINGAFKQIACLCAEAGVAISLGSSFRSAAIADAFDEVQQMELLTQSRLIEAAGESGVQILLEGISHALPQDLEQYITLAQKLCPGIPITALGPLPIDIAVGLDHIAAAIGITFARLFGISLVNIVTSMEHVGMPSLTEIVDALRAARVGLGVADTILTGKHSFPDKSLSKARNNLDWSEQCRFALFPEILAELVSKKGLKNGVSCTICKENCPLKSIHLLWKCAGLKKGFPNGEGGKNEK